MNSFIKNIFLVVVSLTFLIPLFSQDTSTINRVPILVAIEDSLRNQLNLPNDSIWLNQLLEFQNVPYHIPEVKYKLVTIIKRDFIEHPFSPPPLENIDFDSTENSFGSEHYQFLGPKFYTYIGNSSWGFYLEYNLERVYPLTPIDFQNIFPGHCVHGWDQLRGMACPQCLMEYRKEEK